MDYLCCVGVELNKPRVQIHDTLFFPSVGCDEGCRTISEGSQYGGRVTCATTRARYLGFWKGSGMVTEYLPNSLRNAKPRSTIRYLGRTIDSHRYVCMYVCNRAGPRMTIDWYMWYPLCWDRLFRRIRLDTCSFQSRTTFGCHERVISSREKRVKWIGPTWYGTVRR